MKVFEYLRSRSFFTLYFPVFYVLCFTRPRYQVSVYRTIGPLFFFVFVESFAYAKFMFSHDVVHKL